MKALLEPILKNPKIGIPAACIVLLISAMGPGKIALERFFEYKDKQDWAKSDAALLPGSIVTILDGSPTRIWKLEKNSLVCFAKATGCNGEFLNFEATEMDKWRNNECTKKEDSTFCPIISKQIFWGLASGLDRSVVIGDRDSVAIYLDGQP